MRSKFYDFIYERIAFVTAYIFLFQLFAALRLQARVLLGEFQSNYPILNILTSVISLGFVFAVVTFEIINPGKSNKSTSPHCQHSSYYVCYYSLYYVLLTPVLILGELFSGSIALFTFAGLILVNLIILCVWRPYSLAFHNFALIFNNIFAVAFVAAQGACQIFNFTEDMQLIFTFITLGLMMTI